MGANVRTISPVVPADMNRPAAVPSYVMIGVMMTAVDMRARNFVVSDPMMLELP